MTGGWAEYTWPPSIALVSVMIIFLMDLGAERYVDAKYGMPHGEVNVEGLVTGEDRRRSSLAHHMTHQDIHTADQRDNLNSMVDQAQEAGKNAEFSEKLTKDEAMATAEEISFRTQIAAFLILE